MSEAILDPVSEALHNLKLRRDELDRAITALERIRGTEVQVRRRAGLPEGQTILDSQIQLSGMSLASAIITVLEAAGRPLGNAEIVEALHQGGMRFRGTNPPLAVAQGLSRLSQKPGPITKLGRGVGPVKKISFDLQGVQTGIQPHP